MADDKKKDEKKEPLVLTPELGQDLRNELLKDDKEADAIKQVIGAAYILISDEVTITGKDEAALKAEIKYIVDAAKAAQAAKDMPADYAAYVTAAAMIQRSSALEYEKRVKVANLKEALVAEVEDDDKAKDALGEAFDKAVKPSKRETGISKIADHLLLAFETFNNNQKAAEENKLSDVTMDKLVGAVLRGIEPIEERINQLPNTTINALKAEFAKQLLANAEKGKIKDGPETVTGCLLGALDKCVSERTILKEDADKLIKGLKDAGLELEGDGERAKKITATRKAVANSHEQVGNVVRATVAVGAAVVLWNRIKAMFGYKEEPDPNDPEKTIKKRPSVMSQILNGVLVGAVAFTALRVGVQGRSFGDVGNEVKGYWTSLVGKEKPAALDFTR